MEFFFADDSSQKASRAEMGTLVAFGGLFLEESSLNPLSKEVDELLVAAGAPADTEIKWSPPPDNWLHANLQGAARTQLYCDILRAARRASGRALVVAWDTGRTTLQGQAAFAKCVEFAFERISGHLKDRDAHCVVVADRPGGGRRQDDEFLASFLAHVRDGTRFVPPDRVLLNVLTTPSRLIRHLQVADLVVSIVTAAVAGKYTYAREPFEVIKPMLVKNAYGYVGGTGLKLFPDDLVNLYHWVLGEDTFTKVAAAGGWGLPLKRHPYHATEGV